MPVGGNKSLCQRISIESEDTRATERAIRDLVAEAGGFIQSAEVSDPLEPDDQPEIHMVVRIPAGSSVPAWIGART